MTSEQIDYRSIAQEHLLRATALLDGGSPNEILYSCLELRFCIEAIVYQHAQAYLAITGNDIIEKWRPQDVLEELKEADPYSDSSASISVQNDATGEWKPLGTDRRFSLKWARKEYQALGNFLHQPTMKQFREKKRAVAVIREKAYSVHSVLKDILSSSLFNTIFTFSVTVPCDCGFTMSRKIGREANQFELVCVECGDIYLCQSGEGESVQCIQATFRFACMKCEAKNAANKKLLKEGAIIECSNCKAEHVASSRMVLRLKTPGES
jgi:hypothetical protein